jgi:hypothetical protein
MHDLTVVHPVFHVSQLKTHIPNNTLVYSQLPSVAFAEGTSLEPELILDRLLVQKGAVVVVQVLIKWMGLPAKMLSWEDYIVIKDRFPNSSISSLDAAQRGRGEDVMTQGSVQGS